MSQEQPPNNAPFIPPPPPPSVAGSPLYSQEVLAAKAASAASDAKNALILSIVGIFCFGFIFGILAFRKANEALETMSAYGVAQEKRGLATAAKISWDHRYCFMGARTRRQNRLELIALSADDTERQMGLPLHQEW